MTTPGGINIIPAGKRGEQIHQVVIAIRNVAETKLILPIADVLLRGIMILPPVIAAGVEVVIFCWAERPVPAKADDV